MSSSLWGPLTVIDKRDDTTSFTSTIADDWMLAVVPQGGYVTGLAARAMAATLDRPDQRLRSITAVFAGPVAAGPVEVDVTVLRRGRTMSQLTATVRNPGSDAGLTAVAVHGAARNGHTFSFTEPPWPDVPGPDGVRSYRDPIPEGIDFEPDWPAFPLWERILEVRPVVGRAPWEPYEPVPAETISWYRLDEPPLTSDGDLDPGGLLVMCDTMPNAVGQRLGPDVPAWYGPSADLTLHVLGPVPAGWMLAKNTARHAGEGYASVDLSLWDPSERRLVAYATQLMYFVPRPDF